MRQGLETTTLMLAVLLLAAGFGFAAADRWLTTPRLSSPGEGEEATVLCAIVAIAAIAVHATLG